MERLTSSQIADFINPLAFARPREARIGQTVIESLESRRPIKTSDVEASYRLILGAAERLETLEGNLATMYDLSRSARFERGDERGLEEIYGKLRSLSEGFDQVVEAIQFDGRPIFTGDDIFLDLGPGSRPIDLEVSKLLTFGEDSLGISEKDAAADTFITYETEDQILNEAYAIVGLDIAEVSFNASTANPALELETGTYKLKVTYEGPDSTVELTTRTGGLIASKTGVDLSGEGREWVDFENGIRVDFEKESFFQSFDKYDYESLGPAYLNATLNYERINAHVLRTSDTIEEEKVEQLFDASYSADGGTFSLDDFEFAPLGVDQTTIDNGIYTLEVEYNGENSIVKLVDSIGRIQAYKFDADLSAQGDNQVDLGRGFVFNVNNDNFTQNGSTLIAPIQFTKEKPAFEDFDFDIYAKRLEAAIEVVQEQRETVAEAQTRIEEINNLRNLVNSAGIPSALAFASSGALNILSGGGPLATGDPLSAGARSARISTLANQLIGTTNAFPAQANQSPQELANLQLNSASSWLGLSV